MKLILIRHGRTQWNVQGRVQGRTDIPLDETGRAQAAAIAARLRGVHLDAVYTSPLLRAYATAEAITSFHGCGICVSEDITEIRFGAWEGKTGHEIEQQYASLWQNWNWILQPETCREMGAESAEEILLRSQNCMREILAAHPSGATVAVVSHTMPIKLLTAYMIGLPMENIRTLLLGNCSYTELNVMDADHAQLCVWNDALHLEQYLQKGGAL